MNTEKGQSLVEFAVLLLIAAIFAGVIALALSTIFGGGPNLSQAWFNALCASGGQWACR
jgi:hypothetical protein